MLNFAGPKSGSMLDITYLDFIALWARTARNVREPIIKKPPSRRPFYNLPEYRPEARTTKRRHRYHKTAPRHTTHIKSYRARIHPHSWHRGHKSSHLPGQDNRHRLTSTDID